MDPNAQLAALLCGHLSDDGSTPPLTIRQWHTLVKQLAIAGITDLQILPSMTEQALKAAGVSAYDAARIPVLLADTAAADTLACLRQRGIRLLGAAEYAYPRTLLPRLQQAAPPVLFYAGNAALFLKRGVSLTGSRDIAGAAADFARGVGRRAADEGLLLITGGARGADALALRAALNAGGSALVYLPGSMDDFLNRPDIRRAVDDGRLALAMDRNPTAPFSASAALTRNAYIYETARACFVAASRAGRGGTYSGAHAALRRGFCPLYALDGSDGNALLIQKGATPLPKTPDFLRPLLPNDTPARTTLYRL